MSKKSKPRKVEQQEAPIEPLKDALPIVESASKATPTADVVAVTDAEPLTEMAIDVDTPQPIAAPPAPTLDEQLLAIYTEAPPGPISLAHAMVELGIEDPTLIRQAWDRLYDQRKVPFTKLYKPAPGRVGIDG